MSTWRDYNFRVRESADNEKLLKILDTVIRQLGVEKPECDYEKAYNILMEYWDSIADEEKPKADKRLKRCGL